MSTRVARVVRGLIVAAVSLLVAAVAHIAGGGRIGAVGFALALAFSTLVSIGLTGRSISRIRIAAAVLFSQGAFHLLFGVGSDYRAAATAHLPGIPMTGMGMASLDSAAASTLARSTHTVDMPDSGWMWAAHALAALITILALVRGEKAFWYLTGRVSHTLARIFAAPRPVVIHLRAVPEILVDISRPGTRFLLAGLRHRGPPGVVASS
jgi:hypothetical protein